MARPKPGTLFKVPNKNFEFGEHKEGYFGVIILADGQEVELELTPHEISVMVARRQKNAEDWSDIPDENCHFLDKFKDLFG